MLLLYYTHSILFYLGLTTFHTNNDFSKHLHSIDYEYLPQEVCVAKCLQHRKQLLHINDKQTDQSLKICLDNCLSSVDVTNETKRHNLLPVKQIHENYSLNLICRDDTSLNFKIDLHTKRQIEKFNKNQSAEWEITANSTESPSALTIPPVNNEIDLQQHEYETLLVIKVHLANNADKISVYLSDENFFTIRQLMANTTYNISVLAVHSNNKYSVISQQQQFKTLRRSYTPGNVTEIKITQFTADVHNKMHLTATLTWKPAADMTCHYNIICFSPESEDYDVQPLEIRNPRQLYKHQLENLTFSSVYKVGIRASNTKSKRESELFWKTFSVPSCVEWYNYNFNICAPEVPQNLNIEQIIVDQHKYSFNISWELPTHLPDNYTLRVQDLSAQGNATVYNLAKHINNYFVAEIYLYGVFYEVSLTAYTRGGHTTATFTDVTKTVVHLPERNPFIKLIAVILAPIFCVVILSLTIFIIYQRRAKLKRYQQRCKYFEELEKKAPIDPKNTFAFAANLKPNCNNFPYRLEGPEHMLYNDDMEIDSNDLILHQVLGEGAFGLVKLGLYMDRKLGTTQQVAVKMLKDQPTAEDIYAFRREIEVMKSVEKHPNIVGIIGHCTQFSNQMMLITEYCSLGNLLNFLRDEWHFLHKMQIKNKSNHTNISYIDLYQDDDTSSQEVQTTNSAPQSEDAGYSNNTLQHDCGDKEDDNHTQAKPKHNNNDTNDVFEHFNTKYNGLDVATATQTLLNNNYNSKNICNNSSNSVFSVLPHCDNSSVIESVHKKPNTTAHNTISICSPAAENKSYGYHGFCTNSCKCNVDVIIKSIDSSEIEKQHRQPQTPNKTCTETTIEIKNCDCKIKENFSRKKFNGAVENKSYFKLFISDNKHLSRISQKATAVATKREHKTKHLPSNESTTNKRNTNGGANVDTREVDVHTSHIKRVPLSCGDLLNIARQVAVGMEFLAKNKVVHRDVAARNVLVAPDRTIKIADFGLSRDVYQENMYKKTGNGKLPIKWLALESMTHQVYTTQSDVWSYGILLYEIVTLGSTPYPSIPTNRLLDLLKSGYRMEKPKGCCQELYDLMYSCWNSEPIARPTFNSIILKLDGMLHRLDANNQRDLPTLYSEVDKQLSKEKESLENVTCDESYLKPL